MKIFNSIDSVLLTPCVVALGCFDGVHLGHHAVIECAKKTANEKGLPLTVFCFDAPPKNFFFPNAQYFIIKGVNFK